MWYRSATPASFLAWKRSCRKLNSDIRNAKRRFFVGKFRAALKSPRLLWAAVNGVRGTLPLSSSLPSTLSTRGGITNDPLLIAKELNMHFTSASDSVFQPPPLHLNLPDVPPFIIPLCLPADVSSIISDLKNSSSTLTPFTLCSLKMALNFCLLYWHT
eukprot:Pompholyxophrys_punicea_v1_NODE_240_length_2602_cov_8.890895.p2 type:complete len:158 gc:universal NODE_240_length_2602_cov_8.890895:946-473(-)